MIREEYVFDLCVYVCVNMCGVLLSFLHSDSCRIVFDQLLQELERLDGDVEQSFNKYWGQAFRERHELSLFGDQVQNYADIYTSKVSNFLFYSPDQHFRAARHFLPHERETLSKSELILSTGEEER